MRMFRVLALVFCWYAVAIVAGVELAARHWAAAALLWMVATYLLAGAIIVVSGDES